MKMLTLRRDSVLNAAMSDLDKLMNEILAPTAGIETFSALTKGQIPKLNAYKKEDKYCIDFFIPMAKKEDIDVELRENRLLVSIKSHQDAELNDSDYIIREVSRSQSSREVLLGDSIDVTIDPLVTFNNGILHVEFFEVSKQKDYIKKITID